MSVTIYHNPRCSKSRQTLALLEQKAIDANIRLYLDEPLSADELSELITQLDIQPRDLLRKGEVAYKELNLANDNLTDQEIIEAMVSHPKLIERPIVVTNQGAAIGRPPENVLSIV